MHMCDVWFMCMLCRVVFLAHPHMLPQCLCLTPLGGGVPCEGVVPDGDGKDSEDEGGEEDGHNEVCGDRQDYFGWLKGGWLRGGWVHEWVVLCSFVLS